MPIQDLLKERGYLLADGATGTNLFDMGLPPGAPPDIWNLQNPDAVKRLHLAAIEAGSDIVLTNSFGATSFQLAHSGLTDQVNKINFQAARILNQAIRESGRRVIAAGSVGMTGDLQAPRSHEERIAEYFNQITALKEGGVKLIWIETMADLDQTQAAIDAASKLEMPYTVTMSFDRGMNTMMGVSSEKFSDFIAGQKNAPLAYGLNCGGPTSDALANLLKIRELAPEGSVLISKANAGIPEYKEGHTCYSGTPDLMAEYAVLAHRIGAKIIGGCCGTTPDHLRSMFGRLSQDTGGTAKPVTLEEIYKKIGPFSNSFINQMKPRTRRGKRRREVVPE